ncbi:MAG: DNA-3-methyladenine glycosylase [Thermoplasmata archaeon]|nr:DNA-3-methyladenine glycosylase [Thermoplasmata archaeon]
MGSSSNPDDRRLGRAFYDRPTIRVARDLLGRTIHVRGPGPERAVRIVEVEAYVANDPASHTFRGRTDRNRSMFATPGTLYVYRIHQVVCANLVTRRGQAVLLRAGIPLNAVIGNPSGPGRLCRYLGVTREDDGVDTTRSSRVYLTRGPPTARGVRVLASPRIGISQAIDRRLRYSIQGDPWVSRPRPTPGFT